MRKSKAFHKMEIGLRYGGLQLCIHLGQINANASLHDLRDDNGGGYSGPRWRNIAPPKAKEDIKA